MNVSLAAEPLGHVGTFPVTNTLIVGWLIVLALAGFALLVYRRMHSVPGRVQSAVELVIETFLYVAENVTGNTAQARRFFPIAATIFLFVLFSNWVEMVPGLGTIGFWHEPHAQTAPPAVAEQEPAVEAAEHETGAEKRVLVPFIRSTSADLNFTLALAIISVLSVQIFGVASLGFFQYSGKFINLRNPIHFFVGLLELLSEFAKVVSFSFRLFGNIFAGEVLLMVTLFLAPYLVPLPFLGLELFVGFIQAMIFAMLTLVFTKMAVTAHEHE
ncbi:MAG: F0F1 ATP synthase subunit A [Candidatus Hydrogenedentes bacterium]|nr:F0F1 ATP synthase subunit A [Candidatus Hydrogenedentota bacterium]